MKGNIVHNMPPDAGLLEKVRDLSRLLFRLNALASGPDAGPGDSLEFTGRMIPEFRWTAFFTINNWQLN